MIQCFLFDTLEYVRTRVKGIPSIAVQRRKSEGMSCPVRGVRKRYIDWVLTLLF